ncbi:fimbrial protein [Phytobacter sp. AG2a]
MGNKWVLILFLFTTNFSFAATVTCSGGVNPTSLAMPTSTQDKITSGLSGDTSTYREIYKVNFVFFGKSNTTCKASSSTRLNWMLYAYNTSGKAPVKYGNNYIFPTNIDGLGISFNEQDDQRGSPIGSYSNGVLFKHDWNVPTSNGTYNSYVKAMVTVWKMPGVFDATQLNSSGMLAFSGIKIVQALQLTSASDSWGAGLPNRGDSSLLAYSWTTNEVAVTGGLNMYPGTCNLSNQTVNLGKFSPSDIPSSSPWKDVAFTINCPEAWGYGKTTTTNAGKADSADVTNPNNIYSRTTNTANSGIIITVYPRTTIIDNSRSIIGLKTGGAEGYGIQLAWGAAAVQPTTGDPTNKVTFNQPKVLNTTNYGNTGQTTTQLINMAARYIRTTGTVQAGRADASIEVVASYN